MITSNLTGVVCGNSDVLLDQLIDEGVHFDLWLRANIPSVWMNQFSPMQRRMKLFSA